MIEFFGRIDNFWSDQLSCYEFPNSVNTGQNSVFHNNYFDPKNNLLQGFDEELPDLKTRFMQALNIAQKEICSISWTCISPANTIPVHQDKFWKLQKKYSIDIDDCVRYLIFLEDWTIGNYVEFEETIITKWSAGDVWMFDHCSPHCAANASHRDFYTCQLNTTKGTHVR